MILQIRLIKEANDHASRRIPDYNFQDFEPSPGGNLEMRPNNLSLNGNGLPVFNILDPAQYPPILVAEWKIPEQVINGPDPVLSKYFSALFIDHWRGFNSGGKLECVQITNLNAVSYNLVGVTHRVALIQCKSVVQTVRRATQCVGP